jgi:hypothetical protein
MKSILIGGLFAVATLLSLDTSALARPNGFMCGTDPVGDICTCTGTADCRNMRTSGMCNGSLDCTGTTCKCITRGATGMSGPQGGRSGIRGAGAAVSNAGSGANAMPSGRQSKPKPGLPVLLLHK